MRNPLIMLGMNILFLGLFSLGLAQGEGIEGTLFYDKDDHQLKVYANGKWQADRATASKIVAASDSFNKEKADYVCDGTADEVELLASINDAGYYNESVKWLPGTYILSAPLYIPPLQNYLIDAQGATFAGTKGIRFDSLMDCWIYLGVVTGSVTFYPQKPCPIDIWVTGVTTNQIYLEDVVPAAGGTAVILDAKIGGINRNKLYISGCNGGGRGFYIPSRAQAVTSNDIEVGFIQSVDIGATIGDAGASKIHNNKFLFYDLGTNASGTGLQIYSQNDIFEILGFSNIANGKAVIFGASAQNNLIITNPSINTYGTTDSSDGSNKIWHSGSLIQSDGSVGVTGNQSFLGVPSGAGVGQGSIYINPASAASNYTLFGAAVGGAQKLRLDREGDLEIAGNVGIGTTSPKSRLHVVGLPVYADNSAAKAGGLTEGAFYRTGADPDQVCVVY